jgi:hypothetical protein
MNKDLSEEEFKKQLAEKAEAVKLDMKAGRYRNGQLHPNVKHKEQSDVHKIMRKHQSLIDYSDIEKRIYFQMMYGIDFALSGRGKSIPYGKIYGTTAQYIITDECLPTSSEPEEKDWERTKFVSRSDTPPDSKTRQKLRAKRKKRK